jgi:hypothetical protein
MPLEHIAGRPARGPAGLLRTLGMAAGLLTLIAPAAPAHEFWLSPSRYRAGSGDEIHVSALTGEGFGGEPRHYTREKTRSFELLAARRLDLTAVAGEGDSVFARFIAPDDSGAMVCFVSEPSMIEVAPAKFEKYLLDDGLDQAREARAQAGDTEKPGRERFRRCAKTWVAGTGRAGDRSAVRLLRPAGLPVEVVPLDDPVTADTLRVRLLEDGEPLVGALVHAWRRPLAAGWQPAPTGERAEVAPVAAVRTNERGEAAIPLIGEGECEWIVSAVRMVPSTELGSDWESTWASLTFARP